MDFKQSDLPRRGAWAPGKYLHKCSTCSEKFMGDKRALTCADCAYSLAETGPIKMEVMSHLGQAEPYKRIAELEAALRPFVFGDPALEEILYADMADDASGTVTIKLRDIRRARKALPK
jgi:hypothetical protein